MKTIMTNWTKDEFLAYTLLYSAHADYILDQEEKEMILDRVDASAYYKVSRELERDNDYQSLQKILSYTQTNKYSQEEIDTLMHEIELLFMCDGEYDILEKNMMMSLTKLLKHQNDTSALTH